MYYQIDDDVRATIETALQHDLASLKHLPSNKDVLEITAKVTAALAAISKPVGVWTPIPMSLEYDMLTHVIKGNEMPTKYRLCEFRPVAQEEEANDG